jgi:hypothetical protein
MIRTAYRSVRRVARRAAKPAYLWLIAQQQRSSAQEVRRLADLRHALVQLEVTESRRMVELNLRSREVARW